MKVICCLVILSSFGNYVFCDIPLISTGKEYCDAQDKICKTKCDPCPPVVECTTDQTDCGLGTPDPVCGGVCPANSTCVSPDYNCPVTPPGEPPCPATKKTNCAEDQILCRSTESPRNGCPGQDVCLPRSVDDKGNLCPGVCPVECKDDQLKCQTPIDPITKCAKPAVCVSKLKDDKGILCPNQQCPLHCEETEIKCTGASTPLGCKEEDTCAARGKSVSGDLCPGNCPVTCDSIKEVKCNGQKNPTTGCFGPDTCRTKARDVNGEFCPDNSDSHGCPTTCPEDEILCPVKTNILGCKEQAACLANTKDITGKSCNETSVCPTICQPNEITCPTNLFDETSCNKPDVCFPQKRDYDGDVCPIHCPGICGEEQVKCEGHTDDTGCKTADKCVRKGLKTEEPDIGGLCPGACPKTCKHNEVLCASQLDCDGCATDEVCRPKAKDNNGVFCADDSASHDCPIWCNDKKGEVLCTTYETPLGCKPKAMCIARPKASDGQFCPSHSVCSKECMSDEMLCPNGVDSLSCKKEDLCIPRGTDTAGNLCPVACPPVCMNTQFFCPGPLQANGCRGQAICVEKTDSRGCPMPDTGIPNENSGSNGNGKDNSVAPTYTKSLGDCRGGKSPGENAGYTQYDDRNCQERCSNSPTCTGFTLPLKDTHGLPQWCQTKTSVGAIGDGSSPYECFMKSPGAYISSGSCALVGLSGITSKTQCESVAQSLGLVDTTATLVVDVNQRPCGCIYDASNGGWLGWNTPTSGCMTSGNVACGWNGNVALPDDCICIVKECSDSSDCSNGSFCSSRGVCQDA